MNKKVTPGVYYYLASPYSHPADIVRYERERAVSLVGARLMKAGLNLFCPITQSHRLGEIIGENFSHDECMRVDYALLSRAEGLIVVKLPGWEQSHGVGLEIAYAKKHGMLIYYLDLKDDIQVFVDQLTAEDLVINKLRGK